MNETTIINIAMRKCDTPTPEQMKLIDISFVAMRMAPSAERAKIIEILERPIGAPPDHASMKDLEKTWAE